MQLSGIDEDDDGLLALVPESKRPRLEGVETDLKPVIVETEATEYALTHRRSPPPDSDVIIIEDDSSSDTDDSVVDDAPTTLQQTDDDKAYEEEIRRLDVQASSQLIISEDDDSADEFDNESRPTSNEDFDPHPPSPLFRSPNRPTVSQLLADLTQCFDTDGAALFTQELHAAPLTDWIAGASTVSTLDDLEDEIQQNIVRKSRPPRAQLPPVSNVQRSRTAASSNNVYYSGPLPLLVADIHRLAVSLQRHFQAATKNATTTATATCPKSKKELRLFGQRFSTVAFYGRCSWQRNKDLSSIYDVDDGTGTVTVFYAHSDQQRIRLWQEIDQTASSLQALRKKLERHTYEALNVCMQTVRRRAPLPPAHYADGVTVLCIGAPSWSEKMQTVTVRAWQMYEDSGRSRDLELAFRGNLANLYEWRYNLDDDGNEKA